MTQSKSSSTTAARRLVTTESFAIVKPPPGSSSAHHPHNLQVQFIPPRAVFESRSTTSLSSSSTTSSTGPSTSRRIVPLYNLLTHSMTANTINDAGTDDKVAKFLKNGLEIVDLALLQPIELWGSSCPLDFEESTPPTTPLPSNLLLQADGDASKKAQQKQARPKNFMARLFTPAKSQQIESDPVRAASPTPSLVAPVSAAGNASSSLARPDYALSNVLGTVPLLHSAIVPPEGRTAAYVWVTRQWHKSKDSNWLANTLNLSLGSRCEVDLRFEWTRSSSNSSGHGKLGSGTPRSLSHLRTASETDLSKSKRPASRGKESPSPTTSKNGTRLEVPSRSPTKLHRTASSGCIVTVTPSPRDTVEDEGCSDVDPESDPEDSEVPWTCCLVVRPRVVSDSTSSEDGRPAPLRIKVASLAPAPHHPKVVAQLKCSYPLPDVDLLHATIIERGGLPGMPGSQPQGTHMLTAEDIKDIICSTAIWVVFREGFGGLTKKPSKQSARR